MLASTKTAHPSGSATYIDDIFSTYLYTGNGTTQTINNGIDLAGKGGLVWTKERAGLGFNHILIDTLRGGTKYISSNNTNAQSTDSGFITSFNSNGYGFGTGSSTAINYNGSTYASWTFRKQPKFFDVVTWTGDGTNNRAIPHNLQSVPGCIIIKRYDLGSAVWTIFHAGLSGGITGSRILFDTAAATAGSNISAVDSSTFTVISTGTNATGGTYVAYLFAHNAGGFGLTGTDNVISCGSFTTNASGNATVNLGYEPQFLITKGATNATAWLMMDNMRGFPVSPSGSGGNAILQPQTSSAEYSNFTYVRPSSTGFSTEPTAFAASNTYIYIAIRRGPMKVPTSGTQVYNAITRTGTGATATVTGVGFPGDVVLTSRRSTSAGHPMANRLAGSTSYMQTQLTDSEVDAVGGMYGAFTMDGVTLGTDAKVNPSGESLIHHFFKRAPGFMNVVCYTQTGGSATVTHNLGVAPELVILKPRTTANGWKVYSSTIGGSSALQLHQAIATFSDPNWFSATSTSFTAAHANDSTVAYLFASCPGVSRVGSFTGNGTLQTINCGFSAGARFVMVKATSTTGNWVVVDTARGMVAGTDPYLNLNTTAAEVNANNIYTTTGGFQLVSADVNTNANGTQYLYLAIA